MNDLLEKVPKSAILVLKLPMVAAFIFGSLLAFGVASKELLEAGRNFIGRINVVGAKGLSSVVISTLTLSAEHYLISITLFLIGFSVYRLTISKEKGNIELLESQMIGMVVVVMSAAFLNAILNEKATLSVGVSIAAVILSLGSFIYLRERSKTIGGDEIGQDDFRDQ